MQAERQMTVANRLGIHLRAAAKIVKLLDGLDCAVQINFNDRTADAKSIMNVAQLMAPMGSVLLVRADGPDAPRAIQELDRLFRSKFGEE
jgi:phosphotransferase system HPr (HPr) family protein